MDFRKAFDTVPRERLMRRLQDMGVPIEMTWGIMALYRSVRGQVRTPEGLSDVAHSTIGVKQGCPLSPTLFGMYVDEVSDYIERGGDRGAQLAGTWIPLLLYADDIVLIVDSPEGCSVTWMPYMLLPMIVDCRLTLEKPKLWYLIPHHSGLGDQHPLFLMARRQ